MGKLDFKFVELGIRTGLQSEIKRFLDGDPMEEGSMAINSIKTKE
jgi:HlyD family secretion protein